jgi:hypothetical protein
MAAWLHRRILFGIFIFLISSFLFQGCTTGTFYTILDPYKELSDEDKDENKLSFGMQPFSMDAPLLKEKGDKVLQVGVTTGLSVHGAYALTNHIGIYAGASLTSRNDKIDQAAEMSVLREVWDQGNLIDSDSMWTMGRVTGKAKLTQSHLEGGLYLFNAGKRDWHHELIVGAATTSALTKHELVFKYVEAETPVELRESRISYQAFTQYNMGFRNESGEIVWMNRLGRVWQYQREFEPNVRSIGNDVHSPFDFYSTGIRIGSGKAQWHIYAQFERVFPLESTLMRWKRNQFSVGVVIRPLSQYKPEKGVQ